MKKEAKQHINEWRFLPLQVPLASQAEGLSG